MENAENTDRIAEDNVPQWYMLKVQVNREDRVQRELQRRIDVAGLGKYVEEIRVPIESVTEYRNGRKKVTKRKLYPGYIMVKMVMNDDTWFLMRDAPGVGDFTGAESTLGEDGAKRPLPMTPEDVRRVLATEEEQSAENRKFEAPFTVGEKVKIVEGPFKDSEGVVSDASKEGCVSVEVEFLSRKMTVPDLEYGFIEKVVVD